MAAYTKLPLSGLGATYTPIVAPLVGSPATLHVTDTILLDELWVYAFAVSTTATFTLTLVMNSVVYTKNIPGLLGMVPVLQGYPLAGTGAAAVTTTCYASNSSSVWVGGYVIRVNQ